MAARRAAALRRERFRLARRKRALEGGELRRGLKARTARLTGAGARTGRLPPSYRQPRAIRLRRVQAAQNESSVSVVLAANPLALFSASWKIFRSELAPHEIIVVPVRARRALGAAVRRGSERAQGEIVTIATGAGAARPARLARLVEALREEPSVEAAAEAGVRFEWAEGSPWPVEKPADGPAAPGEAHSGEQAGLTGAAAEDAEDSVGRAGESSTVALGGALAAVRGELLRQHPPCRGYRGGLWLTDLSLAITEQGGRLATAVDSDMEAKGADAVALETGSPAGPHPEDLALLRQRWGPMLRQRVLADLLAGGGRWCTRAARVHLSPESEPSLACAVEELGWLRQAGAASADVAVDVESNGRLSVDWLLAGERSAATVRRASPEEAGTAEAPDSTGLHDESSDFLEEASAAPAEAPAGTSLPGENPNRSARELAEALGAAARVPSYCIRIGSRDWQAAGYGGDAALARSLARALGERGHQALVQTGADAGEPAGECLDVLLALRGRRVAAPTRGRLNLIWIISHPEAVGAAELSGYDRVLVASTGYARELEPQTDPPVEALLQFTDPQVFHPSSGAMPEHELAFVGNWRGEFRRIVWDALESGRSPALYGRGWDLLAPEHAAAEHVPHEDLHRIYSSCTILLCDHWEEMRRHGFISNRVFDALACGSFLICDDSPALVEELPDALETYTTGAELEGKLDRYLADPEARSRMARRGREIVLARHTAGHRAEQLERITALATGGVERLQLDHLRGRCAPEGGESAGPEPARVAGEEAA